MTYFIFLAGGLFGICAFVLVIGLLVETKRIGRRP